MLIPGIEPGITAYKTIVITFSLYEHRLLFSFFKKIVNRINMLIE